MTMIGDNFWTSTGFLEPTKTKMLGRQLFLGRMCGRFGALMGPPTVGNGR